MTHTPSERFVRTLPMDDDAMWHVGPYKLIALRDGTIPLPGGAKLTPSELVAVAARQGWHVKEPRR